MTTFPHENPLFDGPRASNFEKNEPRDPFGMGNLFSRFLGPFLTCSGSHFGPFWEPKSSKNEVQKSHVNKEDFHMTLWAPWGGAIFPERGAPMDLGAQDCPPARAVSIDYSLLSIGFCDK